MFRKDLFKIAGAAVLAGLMIVVVSCAAGTDVKPSAELAEASNATLKASLDLGNPLKGYAMAAMVSRSFEHVEPKFEEIFDLYQQDIAYESPLQKGYDFIAGDINTSMEALDLWVETTGSYVAYAARGMYKSRQGFEARRNKYISETSPASLSSMVEWHRAAISDLQTAVELNPRLAPAWKALIEIAMASPMPFTPDEIYREAVSHDNRSFYLRGQYMHALKPRWGGSYEAMSKFAEEAARDAALNPRVYSLLGMVYADQANLHQQREDYVNAEQLYTKALQYGDKLSWLKARATCYHKLNQTAESLADLERVLLYTPGDPTITYQVERMRRSQAGGEYSSN